MSIENGENDMIENEIDKSRDLITPDYERQYDITLRAITKLDDVSREMQRYLALEIIRQMKDTLRSGQPLFYALTVKELADKMLTIACEGAYATICDEKTDDHDYCSKSMMDLIMIIIRQYDGGISSQTLDQLLGNCGTDGEYLQELASLIDLGMVKCAKRDDGSPACFYIPTV